MLLLAIFGPLQVEMRASPTLYILQLEKVPSRMDSYKEFTPNPTPPPPPPRESRLFQHSCEQKHQK